MDHEAERLGEKIESQNDPKDENVASHPAPGASVRFVADSIVGGRYKILSELGRGGMGIVYKVEQVFLHEIYAFKLLQEQHLTGKLLIRFQNEAQATIRLNHRNLVSCKDFGLLEDNCPFLVMECVEGTTLEAMLTKHRALPIKEAIAIFLQVCDGLGYAHDHGIIHRDLKPSNIMLPDQQFDTKHDVVKILDFGIAKIVCDEDRQALTRTGEIFGSPLYMSPEQCLGRNIDHRSDIYAVGCVFFETLTGLSPFAGETALATMMQHQSNTIPTLKQTSLGEDFPQALEQVIARLLAKDPAHRYQTMMALKNDLQRIMDDKEIQWNVPVITTTATTKPQFINAKKIAAAACLVLALALAGFAILNKQSVRTALPAKTPPVVTSFDKYVEVAEPTSYYATVPLKQAKGGPWTLIFPSEGIGSISLPAGIGTSADGHKAQGRVQFSIAHSLVLTPSWGACEKLRNFRRFRSDEIWGLDLSNMLEIDDDVLVAFDHLTGLRFLYLTATDISDRGLEHVKDLPKLLELRVNDSKVTGAGVTKMKCIKHLRTLWVDQLNKVPEVLRALDGSTALMYLSASRTDLTDADMSYIARMPNLTVLRVPHNHITDAGLAKLAALKGLQALEISRNPITTASIPLFKQFKHLQGLYITTYNWSPSQKAELKKILPAKCEIKDQYSSNSEFF